MTTSRFNLRVYGILMNANRDILVSDEIQLHTRMTKFPGGGLEFGEGLAAGLKREYMEELGVEIETGKLLYVNDFLQPSSFDPRDEIIAFYYQVFTPLPLPVRIAEKRFDFEKNENGALSFRWIPITTLATDPTQLTFPIDRFLAKQLPELL